MTRQCIFCDHVLVWHSQMISSKLSLSKSLVPGLLFVLGYIRLVACGKAISLPLLQYCSRLFSTPTEEVSHPVVAATPDHF